MVIPRHNLAGMSKQIHTLECVQPYLQPPPGEVLGRPTTALREAWNDVNKIYPASPFLVAIQGPDLVRLGLKCYLNAPRGLFVSAGARLDTPTKVYIPVPGDDRPRVKMAAATQTQPTLPADCAPVTRQAVPAAAAIC